MFENPPLVERAKEVNDKMVDTIKRLSTLTKPNCAGSRSENVPGVVDTQRRPVGMSH